MTDQQQQQGLDVAALVAPYEATIRGLVVELYNERARSAELARLYEATQQQPTTDHDETAGEATA